MPTSKYSPYPEHTPVRHQPIQGHPPGSITQAVADEYHERLYAIGEPARLVEGRWMRVSQLEEHWEQMKEELDAA